MFGRDSTANTSQRGLEGQTAVLHYLVKRGYEVLIPYGDHRRYDLAVYFPQPDELSGSAPAHLVRIQCKVGWLSEDGAVIDFNTMSVHVRPGGHHKREGYAGVVEYFAVYCPDVEKVYFLRVDEVPEGGKCRLRLRKAKNNQTRRILWAKDFENRF
jgi:PD-(D/E)XK nuclease superfamily protein